MPTVCGACPAGCNIHATTRDGKVKRIQSRNHPAARRWLAVRQGPLLVPAPLRRGSDHGAARPRRSGSRADLLGRRARRGGAPAARRRESCRHGPLGRRDHRDRLRARAAAARRARSALGGAGRVDLVGARCVPRAALDDRRRRADRDRRRRRGRRPGRDRRSLAQARSPSRGRDRHDRRHRLGQDALRAAPPRRWPASSTGRSALAKRLRSSERAVLIWSGPGGGGGARLAEAARGARLRRQARLRRVSTFPRPRTAAPSQRRGRQRTTATRPTPSASRCSSSRATTRRPHRASARWPSTPMPSSRSRCSTGSQSAGPTSSFPRPRRSSARGRR